MTPIKKIRVLDSETINQIAAGEVIESSVSVIKELIENALDAGADEIEVETLGGGQGVIIVKDNGSGIPAKDLPLALQRHATSKISKFTDLFSLASFGFRGEALSAIASIAKMEIITAVKDAEARCVRVHGGTIISSEACVRTVGTTIGVYDLFYNVPVRKGFQKTTHANRLGIKKIIENQILATQGVKWVWINDRRKELSSSKNASFEEKVAMIMGEEFVKEAYVLDCADDRGMAVDGFLGAPSFHRSTRQGQRIFINNRPVDSAFISSKVSEAYSFLLPPNRYPLFILRLQLPPHWCDFNVHPQKTEVRILKTEEVGLWLFEKITEMLVASTSQRVFNVSDIGEAEPQAFPTISFHSQSDVANPSQAIPAHLIPVPMLPISHKGSCPPQAGPQEGREPPQISLRWKEQDKVKPLAYIGDIVLAEDSEGVHAIFASNARKFLFFSSFVEQRDRHSAQHFLVPIYINVTSQEQDFLLNHLEDLKCLGLDLVQVAPCSFALHSAPSYIDEGELKSWLQCFIAEGLRKTGDNVHQMVHATCKKVSFSRVQKQFDPSWLVLLWILGKPEKGLDGSIIRKKLTEKDFY